jgi:cytochrome P450
MARDAADFRPERWENVFEKKVGWGYLPFNGGPRICLGRKLIFCLLSSFYLISELRVQD